MKTQAATGAWSEKKSSNSIDTATAVAPALTGTSEWLLLIALGAAIPLLHATLHWPLKLPGHHGLESMALLTFGRVVSKQRWSALSVATSAAVISFMPILAFKEMGMRFSVLLAGLTIDLLYPLLRKPNTFGFAAIAAAAHATKPLWKWIAAMGWKINFGSLAVGLGFPLLTHLSFGFVGGMIGALLGLSTVRFLQQNSNSH